jgi:hypothetical protein
MGVAMKIKIFWGVTLCSLVSRYLGFGGLFYPEDGESHFFQNTGTHLPNYTVPHPRGYQSSKTQYTEM